MRLSKYILFGAIAVSAPAFTACVGDLDVEPENPTTQTEIKSKEDLFNELGGVYGGLVFEGGITVDDGGAGVYTRQLWNIQELCTDESLIGTNWDDAGVHELVYSTWSTDNHWLYECFSRFNYQISIANQFLRDLHKHAGMLDDETGSLSAKTLEAEARTIRALSYYHMIDVFGKGPWTTENSPIAVTPPTYDRKQLFEAVVADLKEVVDDLVPAAQQIYGRVSREAGYMLLAKLYLNAEVYTGEGKWQECANACNEIRKTIDNLAPTYKYLFCATNDKYAGNGELLWVVPQEQGRMEAWGGTTYLTCGAWFASAGEEILKKLNYKDAWGGLRLRPELSKALDRADKRRLIFEGTFQEEIPTLGGNDATSCGYMLIKYSNSPETDYENTAGNNNNNVAMSNADYPLFRLADTYLMLAECQMHGVECDGLRYLNLVRERAGMPARTSIDADELLRERMCELYCEGHRRSDLIRFGKYTGSNYMWSWKGGDYAGAALPAYRALFPIPTQYTETVGQNPGY